MATSGINFESIVRIYGNEFGFVEDIEDMIKFLKESSISQSEINEIYFRVLEHNNILESKNRPHNKEKKEKKKEKPEETIGDLAPIESKTEIYDVNSYYAAINECEELEMISEYLPSIYDSNYDGIISALLLRYTNEINDQSALIRESDDDELISYCEEEKRKDYQIINIIKEHMIEEQQELEEDNKEEEREIKSKEKRKLVFLQKPDGSYYVDDDLAEIAEADKIIQAIQHIENNTIPRIKRFSSARLKGITVIRRQHTRIEFVELDKNTVAILGVYIKRFQNAKPYFEKLETRFRLFTEQAKKMKEKINSPAYMDEQAEVLDRLKNTIKSIAPYGKEV